MPDDRLVKSVGFDVSEALANIAKLKSGMVDYKRIYEELKREIGELGKKMGVLFDPNLSTADFLKKVHEMASDYDKIINNMAKSAQDAIYSINDGFASLANMNLNDKLQKEVDKIRDSYEKVTRLWDNLAKKNLVNLASEKTEAEFPDFLDSIVDKFEKAISLTDGLTKKVDILETAVSKLTSEKNTLAANNAVLQQQAKNANDLATAKAKEAEQMRESNKALKEYMQTSQDASKRMDGLKQETTLLNYINALIDSKKLIKTIEKEFKTEDERNAATDEGGKYAQEAATLQQSIKTYRTELTGLLKESGIAFSDVQLNIDKLIEVATVAHATLVNKSSDSGKNIEKRIHNIKEAIDIVGEKGENTQMFNAIFQRMYGMSPDKLEQRLKDRLEELQSKAKEYIEKSKVVTEDAVKGTEKTVGSNDTDKISVSLDKVANSADKAATSLGKITTAVSDILSGNLKELIEQITKTDNTMNNLGDQSENTAKQINEAFDDVDMSHYLEDFADKTTDSFHPIVDIVTDVTNATEKAGDSVEKVTADVAQAGEATKKIMQGASDATDKNADATEKSSGKVKKSYSELLSKMKEYYNYLYKSLTAKGESEKSYYAQLAEEAKEAAASMEGQAEVQDKLTKMEEDYEKKSEAFFHKSYDQGTLQAQKNAIKEVNGYYNEQIKILNEISRLSNEQYKDKIDHTKEIKNLESRFESVQDNIDRSNDSYRNYQKEIEIVEKANNIYKEQIRLKQEVAAEDKQKRDAQMVDQAAESYRKIKDAYNEYVNAMKRGDDSSKEKAQEEILQQMQVIENIRMKIRLMKSDSDEYKKMISVMEQYDNTVRNGDATVKYLQQQQQEAQKLKDQQEKENALINDASNAYNRLKIAYSGYISALKTDNADSMDLYRTQINEQNEAIDKIQKIMQSTDLSADAYNKLSGYIEKCTAASRGFEETLASNQKTENLRIMNELYQEQYSLMSDMVRLTKEQINGFDRQEEIDAARQKFDLNQKTIEMQEDSIRNYQKEEDIAERLESTYKRINEIKEEGQKKQREKDEAALVERATEAYKKLQEAYSGYLLTTRLKNDEKRGEWAEQITEQEQILDLIKQQAEELDHNSAAYKKINDILGDSKKALDSLDESLKYVDKDSKQVNNTVDQIFRRIYSMLILRYLRQMLRDCVSYVKEFDAAMTDVRMVTKMSAEDADAFGESIRNAATELRVTSTDLAKGAVALFRQGVGEFNPEEVIDVSKWTAVLAAITSDTSENVLDYMTASLQNFREDGEEMADTAQRVADVWGWMGDKVATTASKIGTAMSKTASSANTAGLSLEKVSAMVAVMQAKTQDSAESIGTSLNSMLSRYMKIAQAGYGAIFEDEDGEMVKVNDVAKAFSEIGIEIYNVSTGFAAFGDVTDQLAAKWDTLTDAQQKYISTQLAGTRNLNRWMAVMNNYDDVLKLEAGAYDSAGAAMEKYSIWMESVEAAQNKLTNSLQNLYSTLDSDVMKGFYNTLSNVVDWLTAATKGTKGLNIVITALGVAVAAVVVSIAKMGGIPAIIKGIATAFMGVFTASKAAAAGVATLNTAMSASLVGIALLVGTSLIGWLISATDNSKKLAEANEKVKDTLDEINDSQKKVTKIDSLFSQLDEIGSSAGTAEEKMNDLNTVRQAIIDMSPEIARKYGLEKEAIGDYADEIDRTAQALRDLQEEQWNESISAARKASSSSNRVSDAYGGMYQDAQKLLAFLQSGGKDASYEGKLYRQSASSIFDSEKFDYEVLSEMSTILGKIWSESEWGGEEGFIDASWLEDYIEEYINDVETKLYDAAKSALYANANKIDWGDIGYTMRYQILDGLAKSMVNNNMNVDNVMSQLNDEMLPYVLDMIDIMNTSAADLIEQSMNSNDIDKRIFSAKKALMNTPLYNFAEDAQQYFSDAWKPLNEARKAFYDKIYTDDYDYIQEFADAAGQFGEEYAEAWHKITYVIDAIRGTEYDNESVWDALTKYLGVDENDPKYLTNKEEYFVDLVNRYLGLYRVAQRETMAIEEGLKFPEGKSPFDTFFASLLGSPSADEDILEKIKGIQTVIKDIDALVQMSEDINNDDFAANMLGGKYDEDLLKRYPQILELLNDEAALQKYIAQIIQEQVDGIRQQGEEYSKLYDQRTEQEYEEDAQKFFAADPEKAEEMWEEFDEETKKYIEDHYDYARGMFEDIGDDYDDLWKDMKDAAKKGTKDINKNIAKAQIDKLFDEKKINKTTKDVLNTLVDNTDDAIDTVSSFTKDVQSLMEAQEALNFVQQDGASEMEGYSDYVKTLSEYLGYDVSTMNDFSMAASLLSGNVLMAGSSAEYLMNTLYAISGATFDASNWQSQLAGLEGGSNSCANALAVLIAYLQSIDGTTINFDGDKFTVGNLGSVKIPKVSGGGGGRGSGGGGDGGGGSSKTKSQVESILEEIKGLLEVIEYERNLYKALQEYYDEQGLTQGVILWMEKESEAIQRSIDTIEKYMGTLESMIKDKEAEIAKLKVGSSAYETAVEELHDLQEAHHDYTVELVESRTEIIKLQKSIEDFNKEIRDMQIEIIEMVEEAIQDREELLRDMRDGTIDVEDAILDAIKARYEKEHEMLEELAQSKIDALNEEIDAIDELLDKRRELNEEEKTANEIAEIEAKLARISADPTRAKEAMELQKKLNDLREEQAWDIAEKEAEAQKASLQEEVDSVEDYIEQLDKYYEDLFEHPQKLIEEMREIIKGTDEEIISWLKEQTEEYSQVTTTRQEAMVVEWQEMIDQMRGITRTYWEEAEQIVSQGDDAIIAFLKEHSADYREAGKLQAEAYVDEWKKKLEELRLALQVVEEEYTVPEYTTTTTPTGGGGSGSGGSAGGGTAGSGGGSTGAAQKKVVQKATEQVGQAISTVVTGITGLITGAVGVGGGGSAVGVVRRGQLAAYDSGGLVNYTGIAQLDGSPMKPERVLSPYQTALFEDMLKTLHEMKTYRFNMSSIVPNLTDGANTNIAVDQINITVEKLDDDQDVAELADKVQVALMDAINRGAAVGGIRQR